MRLKMKENSLFAVLLRSPWWISFLIAAVIGFVATMAMPLQYRMFAVFSGGPFFVIGCMAAWRQWRTPSTAGAALILTEAQRMSSKEFSEALTRGFQRQGYTVQPCRDAGAEFEADKSGRLALIGSKRWKAARHGVEPLKELQAAAQKRGAQECIYIALGELSDSARRFAVDAGIDVVQDVRLAQLLKAGKAASAARQMPEN